MGIGVLLLILLVARVSYFLFNGASFFETYQNLANPYVRVVHISAGLRKEQIADIYGNALAWNASEKSAFLAAGNTSSSHNFEGYYYPDTYLVSLGETGTSVSQKMISKFNQVVAPQASKSNKKIINVDTAVKIASIIQREAAGPQDMKLISGIIWNRLFEGMELDMDATLQYAKGNSQNGWWPQVVPADKKINSPYNTYKNEGLPPSAISNPSLAAIQAAYNPQATDCIFYFHDANRQIHCSATYAEHVAKIKQYFSLKS